MSTLKSYVVPVLAVVAVVVALWAKFGVVSAPILAGANGNQYVENYDSLIRYNGGYNSQLPIKTSSTFTAGGALSATGGATVTGGLTIGASGTVQNNVAYGTCILYQYVNTIAATSSITTDCVNTTSSGKGTDGGLVALAGVQIGDTVNAILSTTTSGIIATAGGLEIDGASASSTNGYVTVTITNSTGKSYTFPTAASSTVSYWAGR